MACRAMMDRSCHDPTARLDSHGQQERPRRHAAGARRAARPRRRPRSPRAERPPNAGRALRIRRRRADARGVEVFIAGAGGAAHLPGVVAAKTTLPVLGVPIPSGHLLGLDALLAIVQMPKGIPVATFAVGKAGAGNAASSPSPSWPASGLSSRRSSPPGARRRPTSCSRSPSSPRHGTQGLALTERLFRCNALAGVPSPLRPLANPPNPWATTDVEYLDGEAPTRRARGLRGPDARHPLPQRQPGRRLRLERQPVPRVLSRLRVLLRAPLARVPELRRRHRLRPQDRGEEARAGAPARGVRRRRSGRASSSIFSGVTDCYQPLEATLPRSRAAASRCAPSTGTRPAIITKSPLVERDIDVLQELGARRARLGHGERARSGTRRRRARSSRSSRRPARRMRTIERLARAGIDVGVMVAPIIPGLNDEDMGDVLRAARDAGATRAGTVLLRLPGAGEGGVRGAAARGAAAARRAGPPPHPGDARRQDVRRALRRARHGRGAVRRGDRSALRADGAEARTTRRARACADSRRSRRRSAGPRGR